MKSGLSLQRSLLILATFALTISSAFAGPAFFVDAGGGYAQLRDPGAFYNSSQSSTASGYGLGMGIWTTFTNGDPILEFQFGIQDHYLSANDGNGNTFGLNLPYGVIRLQSSRIYLSFGYSPYVMRSIGGSSATSDVMSHVSSAYAMLGELGFLLPVTPKFSFGVSGTYETVSDSGVKSPNPIIAGNFFMRFYFGFGGGEGRRSNEFHGWRYPFGTELH